MALRFPGIAFQVLGAGCILLGFWIAVTGWPGLSVPAFGKFNALQLVLGGSMVFPGAAMAIGGRQMSRVRWYWACVLAGVLAVVPLNPLVWPFTCGIGLMSLSILWTRGVRRAFEANDPDHDPDAG